LKNAEIVCSVDKVMSAIPTLVTLTTICFKCHSVA